MKKVLIIIISLTIFLLVAIGIKNDSLLLNSVDIKAQKTFTLANTNTTLSKISILFSKLLEPAGAIILILIVASISIIKNRKYDAYFIIISSGLAISLSSAIKIIFNRTRPDLALISEDTQSFPSNHSVLSAILLCFFLHLISRYVKNNITRPILYIISTSVFVFIPLTRIFLGVHFASDIIAGFSLGIFFYFFTGVILSTISYGKADCGVCLK